MYNDMYPPLWNRTEYFHCLKNPLCSASSSLPLAPPKTLYFYFFLIVKVIHTHSWKWNHYKIKIIWNPAPLNWNFIERCLCHLQNFSGWMSIAQKASGWSHLALLVGRWSRSLSHLHPMFIICGFEDPLASQTRRKRKLMRSVFQRKRMCLRLHSEDGRSQE